MQNEITKDINCLYKFSFKTGVFGFWKKTDQ